MKRLCVILVCLALLTAAPALAGMTNDLVVRPAKVYIEPTVQGTVLNFDRSLLAGEIVRPAPDARKSPPSNPGAP